MSQTTDFILVQFIGEKPASTQLIETCRKVCDQSLIPMSLHRVAWLNDKQVGYLYAKLNTRTVVEDEFLSSFTAKFESAMAEVRVVTASRLENVFDRHGISCDETPAFHYVVEMDPDVGWMPEISTWYDTEHMPGLANVPGCVHAMRMLNHDHGPLSLACYDLMSKETLNSPQWLAIRASAWSDITRPHFTNTKRTLFEVVA